MTEAARRAVDAPCAPLDRPALPEQLPTRPRRTALRVVVAVLSVGLAGYVLVGSAPQLLQAVDAISGLRPQWVVLAVACEALSFLCLGGGLSTLLGGRPGVRVASTIALTAQGAANCLPGGAAVSALVTFQQLRRRGVAPQRTATMVLLLSVLQAAALPLLALVGAQLAGGAEPIPGLRLVSAGLLVGLAVLTVALLALRRHRLPARGLAALARAEVQVRCRLARLRRHGPAPAAVPGSGLAQLSATATALPNRAVLAASALSLAFWLTDALCLACAFPAVRSAVPWAGLLVSYSAAQLASLLPFTPGGLGVVEGSLTVGLVAYGGATTGTLAAVLLYRLVSFWGVLPAAAAGWAGLRRDPVPPRPVRR